MSRSVKKPLLASAMLPKMTDEEACESVLGGVIAGIGVMNGQTAIFLDDGRSIVFEGCERLWIEVKPRMH